MITKPHIRRPLSAALAIAGGLVIFLATETWVGALLLVLGIALELAGIALKHKAASEEKTE